MPLIRRVIDKIICYSIFSNLNNWKHTKKGGEF